MKKLICICFFALLLCACTDKMYEVTYVVYYPNQTKTYKTIVCGEPFVECYRGVNTLRGYGSMRRYASFIAPMEIVNYKEIKTEEN